MPTYAENWGTEISTPYKDTIVLEGPIYAIGGRESFKARILMSERVKRAFNKLETGQNKVDAMNAVFTWDFMRIIAPALKAIVKAGGRVTYLNILFGGMYADFLYAWNMFVGNYPFGYIAVKNERERNNNDKYGWENNRWGYLPDYDPSQKWRPYTEEEKEVIAFVKTPEEVAEIKGKEYFESDAIVCSDGASASGNTGLNEISTNISIRELLGIKLPTDFYFHNIFGSIVAAQRLYEFCKSKGIRFHQYFSGSAISVSPEAIIPGLPFTDLSIFARGSISFASLLDWLIEVNTDLDGNIVRKKCACDDVGDCLNHAESFEVGHVLGNLILRICLVKSGLMHLYDNPDFLEKLRAKVEDIEKNNPPLRNTWKQRITDVISWQENRLKALALVHKSEEYSFKTM